MCFRSKSERIDEKDVMVNDDDDDRVDDNENNNKDTFERTFKAEEKLSAESVFAAAVQKKTNGVTGEEGDRNNSDDELCDMNVDCEDVDEISSSQRQIQNVADPAEEDEIIIEEFDD